LAEEWLRSFSDFASIIDSVELLISQLPQKNSERMCEDVSQIIYLKRDEDDGRKMLGDINVVCAARFLIAHDTDALQPHAIPGRQSLATPVVPKHRENPPGYYARFKQGLSLSRSAP
jgi:hypothetical protein